jgi:integrase
MNMPKKYLTDRSLGALRRSPPKGGRIDIMDTAVPGFGVRVNDAGKLTYILNVRFPGDTHPSRRTLGQPGDKTHADARIFTLADAREEARRWRGSIARGLDPREERDKAKREAEQRRSNTFAAVAEDFIAAMEPTERCRVEVAQAIHREFVKPWGNRPVTEITPLDVLAVIKATKAKGHPHQARNLLGYVRRLFRWAIAQHAYGLERSPCAELQPKQIIGKKKARKRILSDDELRAAWNAAESLGYPYGLALQLLMLTGQRRSEIAEARWPEIDKKQNALIIPAERMKSDDAHVIPLGRMARKIIDALPRFNAGDYLFSTTSGEKPINGFSKPKARLDEAMAAELGHPVEPFVIHDIRRSVRTHLSALPIPQHIAERIIGHAQPGLIQTYDRWGFLEEKRNGIELWEARLRGIIGAAQ